MTFDILTLTGIVFALPYYALLVALARKKSRSLSKARMIHNKQINTRQRYQTQSVSIDQHSSRPCQGCA